MSPETAALLSAIVAVVGLAGTALFKAGQLSGRFDKHEKTVERRLDILEDVNRGRVTREEFDNRFDGLEKQINHVSNLLEKLTLGR